MGFFELPTVDKIKTPGFVESVDGIFETNCGCGGFTTSGLCWRMWLLYGVQVLFLFLCVVIGSNIQSGVGDLGNPYDAVDIIRLVGGIPGIVAALVGGVGVYIRMRYLLMGSVILNTISILFLFISWAIDAADASALSTLAANPPVKTTINFGPPSQKATAACIFGAFGWIITIIAFYLTYAAYQELDSAPSVNEKTEGESPEIYVPSQNNVSMPRPKPMESNVPFTIPKTTNLPPRSSSPPSMSSKPKLSGDQTHHCPQCESEWPIDVKFCGECGSKIPDLVAPTDPQPPPSKPGEVWEEHFTDDGFMYYYNPKTGESKWAES